MFSLSFVLLWVEKSHNSTWNCWWYDLITRGKLMIVPVPSEGCAGIILGMGSANEKRYYMATHPPIGWVHTQNGPWYGYNRSVSNHEKTHQSVKHMHTSWDPRQFIHYSDVIMGAMVSQITILTIVYSTVYSRHKSKKTSKLRVTGLCAGNSPMPGEFPAQRANYAENVSIWWRHHAFPLSYHLPTPASWFREQRMNQVYSIYHWIIYDYDNANEANLWVVGN